MFRRVCYAADSGHLVYELLSDYFPDHHDLLFPSKFDDLHSQHAFKADCFDQSPGAKQVTTASSNYGSTPAHSSINDDHTKLGPIEFNTADKANEEIRVHRPQVELQSLMICEDSKIKKFVEVRLQLLQQLAVKRIAKAWIKGICPKKQATFPYHKKKREREGWNHDSDDIPGWWPPISECRFVEPDHIRRDGMCPMTKVHTIHADSE